MNNIKTLALKKELVITGALVSVVMMAPLVHSQLVTGTIVNAALFSAAMLVGFRRALMVAIIPSLIALGVGTLPIVMAPMIGLIMASNIVLVGVFSLLRKTNYWAGAIVAGFAKFGFLVLSANIVLQAITHGKMSLALASMMGWPQLITAILGSIVAYGINLKYVRR